MGQGSEWASGLEQFEAPRLYFERKTKIGAALQETLVEVRVVLVGEEQGIGVLQGQAE